MEFQSFLTVSSLSVACVYYYSFTGCIPCQEEGNIPFVLENKVGTYSEDPVVIANTVSEWFDTNNGTLEEMSARAKLLGRPEATFNIVRDLAGMSFLMFHPQNFQPFS